MNKPFIRTVICAVIMIFALCSCASTANLISNSSLKAEVVMTDPVFLSLTPRGKNLHHQGNEHIRPERCNARACIAGPSRQGRLVYIEGKLQSREWKKRGKEEGLRDRCIQFDNAAYWPG